MNLIDRHCFKVIEAFSKGEISQEEANKELRKHGDLLAMEMIMDGFSTRVLANPKDWRKVILTTGTA